MAETINLEKVYKELMLLRRDVDIIKSQIRDETEIVDETELSMEFVNKINEIEKQKGIKVDDFSKRYGLN